MKLNTFTGGLNYRIASELLPINEAVVCNNADISSNNVAPINGLSTTMTSNVVNGFYYRNNSEWMPNADTRDYLEYQTKLYWTDGTIPKKYDGTSTYDLGITKPATAPTVVLSPTTGITATVQYAYTYYNVNDGTESEPSALSTELVLTDETANVDVIASADPQVTHIELYRIGGTFLVLNKVAELSNTTQTYTDSAPESSLAIVGNTSAYNGKPPAALRYLSHAYSIFFGSVGSKLYYSREVGNPNYFPEVNYIEFPDTITAIAPVQSGIIVCTYYQSFLITGTTANTFVKHLIDAQQGCINHKTLAYYKNQALFVSTDGLCANSSGGILVMSKAKLGKQSWSTVNAVVHDEVYYLQLSDNSIIEYDLRYTPAFKTINVGTSWLMEANDILYGYSTDGIYQMFSGSAATMTYKTGGIAEGSMTTPKLYDEVWFYIVGTLIVNLYVNGILRSTKSITGNSIPVKVMLPQDYQRGVELQIEVIGTGTLKELSFESSKYERPTRTKEWTENGY